MLIRSTGDASIDAYIEFEVRYNQTRWAEFWLALQMTVIGVVLIHHGNTFDLSPGYDMIRKYTTEEWAGILAFITGCARLSALWVNGSRKRSPLIRVAGCCLGALFWLGCTAGFVEAILKGQITSWPLVLAWFIPSLCAELASSARATRDAVAYQRYKGVGGGNVVNNSRYA